MTRAVPHVPGAPLTAARQRRYTGRDLHPAKPEPPAPATDTPLDTGGWCSECGWHRTTSQNSVCPVCVDEARQREATA